MTEPDKDQNAVGPDEPVVLTKEVGFHYEKSNYFRVIHVDGAHGGLSPDGMSIVMSIFSERHPLPKYEAFDLDESGGLKTPPKERRGRTGIYREVEAAIVMDFPTASTLHSWLGDKINQQLEVMKRLEAAIEQQERDPNNK